MGHLVEPGTVRLYGVDVPTEDVVAIAEDDLLAVR
jgi:hypothetical protein